MTTVCQMNICNGVGMRKREKIECDRYDLEPKDIKVVEAQYIRHIPQLLCVWTESLMGHIPMQSTLHCNPGQWQGK